MVGTPSSDAFDSGAEWTRGEADGLRVTWVETPRHEPRVPGAEWLVGPLGAVLGEADVLVEKDISTFNVPCDRVAASAISSWLLTAQLGCRVIWDGMNVALLGPEKSIAPVKLKLEALARSELPPPTPTKPHHLERRPGQPRHQTSFPARDRRAIEFHREHLPHLLEQIDLAKRHLMHWGSVDTASALAQIQAALQSGEAGLRSPADPEAVPFVEERVEKFIDALPHNAMVETSGVAICESAADCYLNALLREQGLFDRGFVVFGETLSQVSLVEGEIIVEFPKYLATRAGSWPLMAIPLVMKELDPYGISPPSPRAIAARCCELAGDTVRYAVDRWGAANSRREADLRSAFALEPASDPCPSQGVPLARIAELLRAAETGGAYVNETELVLHLAATRDRL